MLCSYHSGVAIDLHEQSPAQQLTISQKNVVDTHVMNNVSWHLECVRTQGIYWPL